ncbi:FUSC family protein [Burkholderia ubonensis]|uniref:FUSC family protein n=1 Tax=Burkholderia ubonensis TaxID=101571 RepID=UPI0009B360BC|nr:FUSC family protein [Burkholderia ubonensis]
MSAIKRICDSAARALRDGRHHLPLSAALKAGLVCAAPALLAATLHAPLLCWAAIAAFWTCLADDASESIRKRAVAGLLFGAIGSLASACATAVADLAWLAVALTGVAVYVGGLARLGGAVLGTRGLLLATACAVSAAFPAHPWPAPAEYAASFAAGSLWAVACLVGLWRESDTARARRAAFAYLYAAGSFVRALVPVAQDPRRSAGPNRATLRTRLDALTRTARSEPADAGTAVTAWQLGGERSIALLAGLESLLCNRPSDSTAAAALLIPSLHRLVALIDAHADTVLARPGSRAAVILLRNRLAADMRGATLRADGSALAEPARTWLQSCMALVTAFTDIGDIGDIGASDRRPAPPAAPQRHGPFRAIAAATGAVLTEIRASGRIARYALRLSVAAMLSAVLARSLGAQQGYWIVLTTLFVVQPTVPHTVRTSGLRVFGTILGAILASAVALACHNPVLLALAIVPLATGTFSARPLDYVSYILFLTPHFILVAYLGAPVASPWLLAGMRVANSIAGALVGLGVSVLAWPEWEHGRLDAVSSRAIADVTEYVELVRAFASKPGVDAEALIAARRRACGATDELDALSAAMRLETVSKRRPHIDDARELVRHLRDAVGAAAPLECFAANMSDARRERLAAIELPGLEIGARAPVCAATALATSAHRVVPFRTDTPPTRRW